MDPLNDFKAILSGDYSNTGNASDEVLQRDAALQRVTAQLQWPEFYCIALCKTKPQILLSTLNSTLPYFTFISNSI